MASFSDLPRACLKLRHTTGACPRFNRALVKLFTFSSPACLPRFCVSRPRSPAFHSSVGTGHHRDDFSPLRRSSRRKNTSVAKGQRSVAKGNRASQEIRPEGRAKLVSASSTAVMKFTCPESPKPTARSASRLSLSRAHCPTRPAPAIRLQPLAPSSAPADSRASPLD